MLETGLKLRQMVGITDAFFCICMGVNITPMRLCSCSQIPGSPSNGAREPKVKLGTGVEKKASREEGESIGIQLSHQADCSVDLGQAICHCVDSSGLSSRA